MVMLKGHGKKAWRWMEGCARGPRAGPRCRLSPFRHRGPPGSRAGPGVGAGAWGCVWLPEVSTTLIRVTQRKEPNPPGAVTLPGHAPHLAVHSLPATASTGKNEIRMSPPRNEPFFFPPPYCARGFSSLFFPPLHLLPPTILPLLWIHIFLIAARTLILKERDKIH